MTTSDDAWPPSTLHTQPAMRPSSSSAYLPAMELRDAPWKLLTSSADATPPERHAAAPAMARSFFAVDIQSSPFADARSPNPTVLIGRIRNAGLDATRP